MLVAISPSGERRILDSLDHFSAIAVGTTLTEDQQNSSVTYLGICNDLCVFVQSNANKAILIYRIDGTGVYDYTPGKPGKVTMQYIKSLYNEPATQSDTGRHTGALYQFQIEWRKLGENTDIGVLITERILPEKTEGWFAQSERREQQIPIVMTPASTLLDLLALSTSTSATSTFSTEKASNTSSNAEAASASSEGLWVAFQYFTYLDENGTQQPIPESGFRLTKQLKAGRLSVQRVGAASGNIAAGVADGFIYTY